MTYFFLLSYFFLGDFFTWSGPWYLHKYLDRPSPNIMYKPFDLWDKFFNCWIHCCWLLCDLFWKQVKIFSCLFNFKHMQCLKLVCYKTTIYSILRKINYKLFWHMLINKIATNPLKKLWSRTSLHNISGWIIYHSCPC